MVERRVGNQPKPNAGPRPFRQLLPAEKRESAEAGKSRQPGLGGSHIGPFNRRVWDGESRIYLPCAGHLKSAQIVEFEFPGSVEKERQSTIGPRNRSLPSPQPSSLRFGVIGKSPRIHHVPLVPTTARSHVPSCPSMSRHVPPCPAMSRHVPPTCQSKLSVSPQSVKLFRCPSAARRAGVGEATLPRPGSALGQERFQAHLHDRQVVVGSPALSFHHVPSHPAASR